MVGDGDRVVAVLGAQLAEPFVAQSPCGDLHRFPGGFHLALRVESAVEEGEPVVCGTCFHERFVLVGLLAAQLEVAVGDSHSVTGRYEKVHHDHRIHSAADGEQNPVARLHQCVFPDVSLKFLFEHTLVFVIAAVAVSVLLSLQVLHLCRVPFYHMFTSVAIRMPNRVCTSRMILRASAVMSLPLAPPRFTRMSACLS